MSTKKSISLIIEDFGPAMRALNPRQQAFVIAIFDLGADGSYYAATVKAGYVGERGYLDMQAHRLAHNDKIQAAMREEAERRCAGLLGIAHAGMAAIIGNPAHQDHFKAIKHAQALAGLAPTQKHEVVHKNDTASLKADLLAAMDLLKSVAGPMIDVTPTQQDLNLGRHKDGMDGPGGCPAIENHSHRVMAPALPAEKCPYDDEEDWIAT